MQARRDDPEPGMYIHRPADRGELASRSPVVDSRQLEEAEESGAPAISIHRQMSASSSRTGLRRRSEFPVFRCSIPVSNRVGIGIQTPAFLRTPGLQGPQTFLYWALKRPNTTLLYLVFVSTQKKKLLFVYLGWRPSNWGPRAGRLHGWPCSELPI